MPTTQYSFSIPDAVKQKLRRLYYPELKALAAQVGNQAAFRALDEEREDFEAIAARVGAEDAFREYCTLIECSRDSMSCQEAGELPGLFYIFLLAKICFPEELSTPDTPPVATGTKAPSSER